MIVKTLTKKDLINESHGLAEKIIISQWIPDLIIGIALGGIYVSRPVRDTFKATSWQGKYFEIKLSRVSSHRKQTFKTSILLKRLPYPILNVLRNIEVYLFEKVTPEQYNPSKEQSVIINEDLTNAIKKSKSILLVDDTLDSGSTILAIRNVISRINMQSEIKSAVLTITHRNPYIVPDFTVYDRVLLRSIWSDDYRGDDHV